MKIIDSHIHIGKWGDEFYNLENDIEDTIKVLKKFNIEEAVCMPARLTSNDELFREVQKSYFKFHYCCWINPLDKDLDNFIEKNLPDIKLFKFHPSFQRMRVTDEKYRKYFQLAESNNKPVIIHCGRWSEIAGYTFALEKARGYPRLNVILAHLGGDSPDLCIPCAKEISAEKFRNVYLGTESIREIHYVREVVKNAGYERIIFGSDYNLCLPGIFIPNVEYLNIPDYQKEMIFSGNIKKLLNE